MACGPETAPGSGCEPGGWLNGAPDGLTGPDCGQAAAPGRAYGPAIAPNGPCGPLCGKGALPETPGGSGPDEGGTAIPGAPNPTPGGIARPSGCGGAGRGSAARCGSDPPGPTEMPLGRPMPGGSADAPRGLPQSPQKTAEDNCMLWQCGQRLPPPPGNVVASEITSGWLPPHFGQKRSPGCSSVEQCAQRVISPLLVHQLLIRV